ncbi:DUF5615 family PIN-like protein [Halovivax cerinus]|uniref:DUF5615 family PIN-like protein n=1 Tax=Halovivax cerinus TaxID=1487865 RepID=A0ABD5NLP7_9EURY|nr:Mut7-C RNAse domain-containing protein [Halovivax cerinus]
MRLLVDVMCGRLVSYLRMCGHDTIYAGDRGLEADDDVLSVAAAADRTILTRDVALADRAAASVLLESRDVNGQLADVLAAGIDLTLPDVPTRCGRCNGRLGPVEPGGVTPAYAPDPADERCWQCRDCGQYFWRGSHWDRVRETLASIVPDT